MTTARLSNDYEALLIGNDPAIGGLARYRSHTSNGVLFATSGFRCLSIAMKLAVDRIVLIDNSANVIVLWQALKQLVEGCDTETDFARKLSAFLAENAALYRHLGRIQSPNKHVKYPPQDLRKYFTYVCGKLGFREFKRLILAVKLINQSWANVDVIASLAAQYQAATSYVYLSNIIASLTDQQAIRRIIANVGRLSPCLVIASDLCPKHLKPEHIHLIDTSIQAGLRHTLFAARATTPRSQRQCLSDQTGVSDERCAVRSP